MSCQAANAKEKIHIGDNKEHTAFVHAVQKFGVSANVTYILSFFENKDIHPSCFYKSARVN